MKALPGWMVPGLFRLCLVGLGVLSGAAATPTLPEFEAALARRDFAAALQLVDAAQLDDADDPEWQLARADLTARLGRPGDALGQIRETIARAPEHRRARLREAQMLTQVGRLRSAAQAYTAYLEEHPDDHDARAGLGLTHLWRGHYHRAFQCFDQVLLAVPEDALAWQGRLRCLIDTGQPTAAWGAARQRDETTGSQDAELGLLLAGLVARTGEPSRAASLAQRPTSDPDLARRQAGFRAQLLVHQGRNTDAVAEVADLAGWDPPDYDALLEAADVFGAADRRQAAAEWYERARRLVPERPEARLGLARLASREGRLAGSLTLYRQVVEANPEALEGWLGLARTAVLLGDVDEARAALASAATLEPGSAAVFREQLRVALVEGDLDAFDRLLAEYRREQPEDLEARLWAARRAFTEHAASADPSEPLTPDLLAPDLAASLLRLRPDAAQRAVAQARQALFTPTNPLPRSAAAGLGDAFARILHRDAAQAVAELSSRPAQARGRVLAAGWWAYVSTPLAYADHVRTEFDPQATAVWLADEVTRRLRNLQVETESPLFDDWLLARARWFKTWQHRWHTPEAAADLQRAVVGLVPDWSQGVTLDAVQDAWRLSEAALPPEADAFPVRITRARWRLYRQDFTGALDQLRALATLDPDAAEPAQRQAEVLRAAGRLQEAARLLQRWCLAADAPPAFRLEYADLLHRLGRIDEAQQQLRVLEQAGFEEPEFHRQQAALADRLGRTDAARDAFQRGLERHPRSALLHAAYAGWLIRHDQRLQLAEALAANPTAPWVTPDLVAAAGPALPTERRAALEQSARWWFHPQWLGVRRLGGQSLTVLQQQAESLAAQGAVADALARLQPALDARLPDSELWLSAARLFDFTRRFDESERAYRFATELGCGRMDTEVLRLAREAWSRPDEVAREFQRRLDAHPEQRALRVGLVQSLLHAGEVAAAGRALAPLVEEDPFDAEVRTLAAQIEAARGRVRQARSLHESLLRRDPLAADSRAARRALNDAAEMTWGLGYEYSALRDTAGDAGSLPAWHLTTIGGSWHVPTTTTLGVEYQLHERDADWDQQLGFEAVRGLGRDWIVRAQAAFGIDPDYTAAWRLGAGAVRRVTEQVEASLDAHYLQFRDVSVWQAVPAVSWRWHPRGTVEARLYLGHNRLESGRSNESVTWVLNSSWQIGGQSLVVLRYAGGDENAASPTANLIGNDRLQSVGAEVRIGGRHRWSLTPAYRYEIHDRFDLQALSLSLGWRR